MGPNVPNNVLLMEQRQKAENFVLFGECMLHSEHNLFISLYNRTHTYAHIDRTMSDKKRERGLVKDGILAHWTKINDKSNSDAKQERIIKQSYRYGKKVSYSFFSKCDNDDMNECDIKWWCGADFNQTKRKEERKTEKDLE